MAPIMPYITEELYQIYFREHEKAKSIHISEWPKLNIVDEDAEKIGDFAVSVIEEARKAKSKKNLSLKAPVKSISAKGKITKEEFESVKRDIEASTNCQNISYSRLDSKEKEFEVEVDI